MKYHLFQPGCRFAVGLLALVCALSFGGCGAPAESGSEVPEQREVEAASEPVSSAKTEPMQRITASFPDGLQLVSVWSTVEGENRDPLAPNAVCEKAEPRGGDLLEIELLLPVGVTMRSPKIGEAAYADGCANPINLYQEGELVGTVGCDRFTLDQIARWDGEGVDGTPIVLAPEEEYQAVFWMWKDWFPGYTPVAHSEDYSYCAGVCPSNWQEGRATNWILFYDKEFLRCTAMEVREDAFTEEELISIAKSIRLSLRERPAPEPLPIPVIEPPAGYVKTRISFPAYQDGREDYNAAIYDTTPFELRLSLPEGWSVRKPADTAGEAVAPFTPMELWDGEKRMGGVGYMTYDITAPTLESNYYRMVYQTLMLVPSYNWDNDYTPVTMTETACTATARVSVTDTGEEWAGQMPDAPVHYYPAILSYDETLLTYVAFSFEEDAVTDEELLFIAKSVRLYRPED